MTKVEKAFGVCFRLSWMLVTRDCVRSSQCDVFTAFLQDYLKSNVCAAINLFFERRAEVRFLVFPYVMEFFRRHQNTMGRQGINRYLEKGAALPALRHEHHGYGEYYYHEYYPDDGIADLHAEAAQRCPEYDYRHSCKHGVCSLVPEYLARVAAGHRDK